MLDTASTAVDLLWAMLTIKGHLYLLSDDLQHCRPTLICAGSPPLTNNNDICRRPFNDWNISKLDMLP